MSTPNIPPEEIEAIASADHEARATTDHAQLYLPLRERMIAAGCWPRGPEVDCTCYEVVDGHQRGCMFYGQTPEQIKETHRTAGEWLPTADALHLIEGDQSLRTPEDIATNFFPDDIDRRHELVRAIRADLLAEECRQWRSRHNAMMERGAQPWPWAALELARAAVDAAVALEGKS